MQVVRSSFSMHVSITAEMADRKGASTYMPPVSHGTEFHNPDGETVTTTIQEYVLTIRGIMAALISVVALLSVFGAAAMIGKVLLGSSIYGSILHGVMHLFDLGLDGNIPTWYASASLLLCAFLLFAIARTMTGSRKRWTKHWYGLSSLFLVLSIDETATIHERAGDALDQLAPVVSEWGGLLFYSWVLIGLSAVLMVTAVFLRFTLHLPKSTRNLFVLAAAVFVSGGLGAEMINAWIHDAYGTNTLAYAGMTVVEELLEMTGVLIFIYALLNVLRTESELVQIRLGR